MLSKSTLYVVMSLCVFLAVNCHWKYINNEKTFLTVAPRLLTIMLSDKSVSKPTGCDSTTAQRCKAELGVIQLRPWFLEPKFLFIFHDLFTNIIDTPRIHDWNVWVRCQFAYIGLIETAERVFHITSNVWKHQVIWFVKKVPGHN
jgi:hypothetical protein